MPDKNYESGTSRSFGDFIFKPASSGKDVKAEDVISSVPEIREFHLEFVKDDFIILGCDGLFDHLDNQEIVDFVHSKMSDMVIGSQDTQKVADELVQFALKASREKAKDGKSDNISVIIVPLTRAVIKAD